MSHLRVQSFSISIDGYGARPNQDTENPLGVGGLKVFDASKAPKARNEKAWANGPGKGFII